MKNCNKCARLKYNYEGKLFRCGRNADKTFNEPKLHGMLCKHYASEVIRKEQICTKTT